MMGTTAVVQSFERVSDEDGEGVDVKLEPAGETGPLDEAEHFASSGDDAPPLPKDFAAVSDAPGRGSKRVTGYVDPKNAGTALGGEKRIYARDPVDGSVVAEIWLKGTGDISIVSIKSGGKIILNGVGIDQQGNIKAPGDVTAMSAGPGVKLSTHLHGSGTGPTTAPTPGT
jgi:hypothetical protein